MLIRKPFAFLIKNFRKIHLIISLIMAFVSYKLFNISAVFSNLVASNDVVNIPSSLIDIYFLLSIIVLLVFSIFMYALMKKKEKPNKLYLFMIIFYVALFILYFVASSLFKDIEQVRVLSLESKRVYQDVSRIFTYPQYAILLYCIFRTIGFDIKKFNFGKDLRELDISQSDNEEFEFVLGFDFSNILPKFRRRLRELRYYFLENTKAFLIIIGVIILSIVGIIGFNFIFGEKTYGEATEVNSGNFKTTIVKSYITNLSQNGQILDENKYYFIINMKISSLYGKDHVINTSDYKIMSGSNYYLPTFNKNLYFIDLGRPYNNEALESSKDYSFLLIYEIEKSNISKEYKLKITGNSNGSSYNYYYVKLKPTIIENVTVSQTIDYKADSNDNIIDLSDSLLGETYITLDGYEVTPIFQYNYMKCYEDDECYNLTGIFTANSLQYNSTLLVLTPILKLNATSYYSLNNLNSLDFYKNFISVQYTSGTEILTLSPTIKNTLDYQDKIVLEIPQSVSSASRLAVVFTVRNKRYVINLR